MPATTLLWYDYETTGTDVARDRPLQFAAQRTGLDLQPLGDPARLFCAPSADVLPDPHACVITGIAPQDAARQGVREAEFAGAVHALLAEPGTCSVGYNSIRFDDEINRHLFYRNFFDPYEHAWKAGTARWDVMDLARACYALRPDGILWPCADDGSPSFKLDRLAPANHLHQEHAHDASSDVDATIGLARLLRQRQPRLYDWHFALRDKRKVSAQLAQALPTMEPLLHVSGRYPARRGCIAMVAPVAEHPDRAGTFIVADLAVDPRAWMGLDADDLRERMFTARADLPEDIERPPLKEVHANKSPFLAPVSALKSVDRARIALDDEACLRHLAALRACVGVRERVRRAFTRSDDRWPARRDPELQLYGGAFPSDADKRRFERVRTTAPAMLGHTPFGFEDTRYDELLFRYRARNWPDTLASGERDRWEALVRGKLTRATEATTQTLDEYFATITALRATLPPGAQQALLDRLQDWGNARRAEFGL